MSKSAKNISVLISKLMQENKLTLSDITRGMVVLENLALAYTWKGPQVVTAITGDTTIPVNKRSKTAVVLEEACAS